MSQKLVYLWESSYGVAAAAANLLQSCLTLCDPIDSSPPGSSVPGILQARILEHVASPFSNAWEWKVKVKSPSRVRLFETPWTVAYQAPPSMGFSRREYWSGLPFPSPSYGVSLRKKSYNYIDKKCIFTRRMLNESAFYQRNRTNS